MVKSIECRHGKPYYEHCNQCGSEYRHVQQHNARIKQTNDALVGKARELGRTQTIIDKDGCEVTATPEGRIFYNMADWY